MMDKLKDKSILRAFGLETKNKGAGVKQLKTLTQTKEEEARLKAAEEAKKQKGAENAPGQARNAAGNGQANKQKKEEPKGPAHK